MPPHPQQFAARDALRQTGQTGFRLLWKLHSNYGTVFLANYVIKPKSHLIGLNFQAVFRYYQYILSRLNPVHDYRIPSDRWMMSVFWSQVYPTCSVAVWCRGVRRYVQ
ncbi:hypothetical protein AVEN_77858-1 [Araneus ventricosus]|uniref:Uncharacterized protein n=1 Tax=Araneus ventricosus TaxID=182803 RepID=A0A4Y2Q3R4_ARAVE|nr:hypothetical protein AVEN_77858-1 [Araneus ventricosus]